MTTATHLITATIILPLLTSVTLAESPKLVSMEVALQHEKTDEYSLAIKITNNGPTTVILEKNSLPWAHTYYFLLLAVRNNGVLLEERLPVALPPGGPVSIKAGETLDGKVSLNERFPALPEEIKRREIIIFWSSQLILFHGADLERLGGWLLMPRLSQPNSG